MNKGLEVIEAHHLFGVAYDQIDVVVHPQSIVHALVHLNDGASLAHLGYPDMRVPISYALHYPERADVPVETLDLATVGSLDFEPPDEDTFACLRLAREAGAAGGTAPCVLNAANEVAVHAFLDGELPVHRHRRGDRARARRAAGRAGAPLLRPLPRRRRSARARPRAARGRQRVSWFLAFAGFALLVILHELGHFAAAKAVGMRVERFSLFFPPTLSRKKVGETEYAIGAIPAGRLREDHRDEPGRGAPGRGPRPGLPRAAGVEADRGDRRRAGGEPRAGAGAAVRVLRGDRAARHRRGQGREGLPGRGQAQAGRQDHRRRRREGRPVGALARIAKHRCAEKPPTEGLPWPRRPPRSSSSATAGARHDHATPIYDPAAKRTRLGFGYAPGPRETLPTGEALTESLDRFWFITEATVTLPARLFDAEKRKEISAASWAPTRSPARRSSTTSPRWWDPRAHLAVAGDHQPVPVPAARRRPHLLGDRGEGARAPRAASA